MHREKSSYLICKYDEISENYAARKPNNLHPRFIGDIVDLTTPDMPNNFRFLSKINPMSDQWTRNESGIKYTILNVLTTKFYIICWLLTILLTSLRYWSYYFYVRLTLNLVTIPASCSTDSLLLGPRIKYQDCDRHWENVFDPESLWMTQSRQWNLQSLFITTPNQNFGKRLNRVLTTS